MTMTRGTFIATTALVVAGFLGTTAACSDAGSVLEPDADDGTVLLNVEPEVGSTDVDPSADVVLEFSHPMDPAMSDYADVHEGDLEGPEVGGAWSWSEDHTVLTFRPEQMLERDTTYAVHLGGGMMDADGEHVNLEEHGSHMGGQWATGSMMGSDHGGGMMGDGSSSHMGDGWEHPSNGSYGMVFRFTTSP